MKLKHKILTGSLALLVSAGSIIGQDDATKTDKKNLLHGVSVGANLGSMLFYGDIRQYDWYPVGKWHNERRWGIGLNLNKAVNPVIGFQGELLMGRVSGVKREARRYFDATGMMETSLNMTVNISNMMYSGKSGEHKWHIVGKVGLGMVGFRTVQRALIADDDTDPVINYFGYEDVTLEEKAKKTRETVMPVALGATYKMNDNMYLLLETSARRLNSDKLDAQDVAGTSKDIYGFTSVGIIYKMGGTTPEENELWENPLEALADDVNETKAKIDGLSSDSDGDGVSDLFDKERNTPQGALVDGSGQALDSDGDGVPNYMDKDPFSNKGAKVDENGIEVDSDGDGVVDSEDLEPNTEKGALVNFAGVTIDVKSSGGASGGGYTPSGLPDVYFDLNSSSINYKSYSAIAEVAKAMKANADLKLTAVGHTDATGSDKYNQELGRRRSQAVVDHLVKIYGIDASRLSVDTKGKAAPMTTGGSYSNVNRRVEFIIQE